MTRLTANTPPGDVIDRVVRHYNRLFELGSHDREDIAQECWLGLLRYPHGRNYLTCRDAAVRAIRRQLWLRRRDALRPTGMPPASLLDEVLDVPHYLAALTPRELQVVRLFFWDDLSMKEIGDRLGIHWTTAATLKRDALAKMREAAAGAGRSVPTLAVASRPATPGIP